MMALATCARHGSACSAYRQPVIAYRPKKRGRVLRLLNRDLMNLPRHKTLLADPPRTHCDLESYPEALLVGSRTIAPGGQPLG